MDGKISMEILWGITIAAAIVTFILFFFYVEDIKNENTELKRKVGELEKENTELKRKVGELEKENTELKRKVGELERLRDTSSKEEVKEIERQVLTHRNLSHIVNVDVYFYPSGWMGDGEYGKRYIIFTRTAEHINITYTPGPKGWAGIYWQYPDSNWGEQPGRNLMGIQRLTFWAKGKTGNEIVEFKTGGIRGKRYEDSFEKSLGRIKLSQDWKQYEINLADQDLSSVIGAFAWVASKDANPHGLTFYLKDIYFRK